MIAEAQERPPAVEPVRDPCNIARLIVERAERRKREQRKLEEFERA